MNPRCLYKLTERRILAFAFPLASILVLMGKPTSADTVDLASSTAIASFQSEGLVDISDLGSWNGEPVTEDNQPSDHVRRLSASLDFFEVEGDSSAIWLRVSNVISTQSAWWSGSAFTNTIMTGIDLQLRSSTSIVDVAGCDFGFANPGQSLLGTEEGPISETLGWALVPGGLRTQSGWNFGFAEYGYVNGAVIQEGGGLFQLRLGALASEIDWSRSQLTLDYGVGNQSIEATFNNPVPSIGTGFAMVFSILTVRGRRR